jgi:prepilin-type N-terminal cleavage/methylation domain-containing protein
VVSGQWRSASRAGFTLIEIMVVIGIMAIIFAIAIPSIYRQLHKDSMRQAVSDVLDACSRARERAILSGTTCNVHIRPRDHTISVSGGGSAKPSAGGNSTYSFEGDQMVEHVAGSGELFSAKISDRITFFFIAVNEDEELQELDEIVFAFLPNGTADQVDIVLRSDQNEARGISVDVITGIASVQESKNGGRF